MEEHTVYKPWTSERDGDIPFVADDLLPEVTCTLLSVSATSEGRLAVTIKEEKQPEPLQLEFPSEYLRLSCECSECFIQSSQSHSQPFLVMMEPADLRSATLKNNQVEVIFTNEHVSSFPAAWLYNRRMTKDGATNRVDSIYFHKREGWSNENFEVQSASLKEISDSPEGFLAFGEALMRDGIFTITDCPDRNILPDEFEALTGLVGFSTHYGQKFDLINHAKPVNLGYSPKTLGLHVDLPMLARFPRLQMLHCRVACQDGGANILTDGMKAADILRERHPDKYETLTTQHMEFEDIFPLATTQVIHEAYYANSAPTIVLDSKGTPVYLQWTVADRSSYFNGSPEEFDKWMEAVKIFYAILLECSMTIKIKAGHMLIFDNMRIMHGRESFNASQARHLVGCYTDWDYLYSRLRVARMLITCRKRNANITTEKS